MKLSQQASRVIVQGSDNQLSSYRAPRGGGGGLSADSKQALPPSNVFGATKS